MTDEELLELAAKAAGIEGRWERDTNFKQERWYFNVPYDNHNMLTGFEWNPLTDDGDALRLAVKLGIRDYFGIEVQQTCVRATAFKHWEHCEYKEYKEQDPCTATRRAIVMAAAEIGKGMK